MKPRERMGKMTPKQRLLAAIAHREGDRVPVSPRMPVWVAGRYGSYSWVQQLKLQVEFNMDPLIDVDFEIPNYITYPFSGDYQDLEDVSVEIAVKDQDEIKIVRRHFHTPAGHLTDEIALSPKKSRYGVSPSPTLREPLVKDSKDVDKIRFLLPDPREVKGTNYPEIIEIIGERGLLQVHPCMMLSGMTQAMGISETMVAFYNDRQTFDRLLKIFGEYCQQVIKTVLELGAPVLWASWHNFGSAGWSPEIWREVFKPWIKAGIDLTHDYGAFYTYFDNGWIMPLLPDLAEIGVDIVCSLAPPPTGDVNLREAIQLVGDQICLWGYVDVIEVMYRGTPAEVRKAVRQAIAVAAPKGGFILGNSDSFMFETPQENIKAFFEAAHEFGHYPIKLS